MILEASVTTDGYCHVGREWWVLAPGVKRAIVGLLSEVGLSFCSHADNHLSKSSLQGLRFKCVKVTSVKNQKQIINRNFSEILCILSMSFYILL